MISNGYDTASFYSSPMGNCKNDDFIRAYRGSKGYSSPMGNCKLIIYMTLSIKQIRIRPLWGIVRTISCAMFSLYILYIDLSIKNSMNFETNFSLLAKDGRFEGC